MAKSSVSLKLVTLSDQKDWIQFIFNEKIRGTSLESKALDHVTAACLSMGFEPSTMMVSKLKGERHDYIVVLPSKQNSSLCNHVIAKQQERRLAEHKAAAEARRNDELARIERVKVVYAKHGKKIMEEMQGLFA